MADAATVTAVKFQIPDEAVDYGFDDSVISALLDSGLTQSKTILAVLRGVAAKVTSFEDVSESGSSRSTRFFDNLKALIDLWQAAVDKEDLLAGTNAKEGIHFYTTTRV